MGLVLAILGFFGLMAASDVNKEAEELLRSTIQGLEALKGLGKEKKCLGE